MTIRQPNNSYVILAGNGTQTAFSFPFASDRFEDDDVFVYVWNGTSEQWDKKTVTTHYTLGSNTVTFGTAPSSPPTGVTGNVLVIRKTDVDEDFPRADFQPGSSIRAQDLDNNQLQALRGLKELRDEKLSRFAEVDESTGTASNPKMYANLDMTGRNIENIGKAGSDNEAANREMVGGLIASDITADTTQGVVLNKSVGGTNSGDQMEVSIADSSPSQKGSVIIEQAAGEAVNVSYSSGTATIGVDKSTATQQGVVQITAPPETNGNPIALTRPADGEVELTIADASITSAKIADSAITSAKILDGTIEDADISGTADINGSKLLDNSVTSAKIATNSVTTAKIVDSAVTSAKIADNSITSAKITDSAVTSAKIADGTIVNADINASAAIDGSKLANNSVDLDKIVDADIVVTSDYSTSWATDDTKIATVGSLAARHDVVVNTNTTPPSTAQTGKQWLSIASGNQVHKIYDGTGWRTVAVGQPYSPLTTTIVRYVDATNGSDAADVTGFLPQAPLRSIGRALELINASSSGDGTLIKVEPGVYQETLPLRIKKNNVSIVGTSMRSCFVHPTVATENNDMFEVDSGSYIANFTMCGLKVPTANQGSRNNSLDNDATYGLPSNQPFAVRFRTDTAPVILKSPYIQNCSHFSDAHFDNANFDPNTFPSTDSQTYSAVAGDQSSAPSGGGLLVDGSAVSSSSPIRSMVVDAFTQITLDGPGILVTNNGYAQLVSFFGTFAHYHAKAKNGGQINLSNCVSDFGRYGLIADGKSPSAIATATASAANSGATTITIGAITTDSGFHGTVNRPLDHMMVTIDGVDYGVVSSTANGSGWDVVLTSGLTSNITNTTVSFALRSYISTGGHTFEFVGVGTDYSDHPDFGGIPVEANQVIELNGGKVWQSSTDHVGKFKAGDVLVVDQVSETVNLKATTVTGNLAVTGTVDGRDVATDGTKLDGIEALATADQTAAEIRTLVDSANDSNVFTDDDHTKLDGIEASATADQTGAEIKALYEAEANAYTDTLNTKLAGIEAGAEVGDADLDTTQTFTKAQRGSVGTLTDGATITADFAEKNNFTVTLGGNRTLANPSNLTAGQSGVIVINQDGTGNRTLAYGTYWKFAGGTAPTLSTGANEMDVLSYYVVSSTVIVASLGADFS